MEAAGVVEVEAEEADSPEEEGRQAEDHKETSPNSQSYPLLD
jgi:hypothetical protein